MASTEKYLKPEVIRQVSRLDLRAKFIVQGFLAGSSEFALVPTRPALEASGITLPAAEPDDAFLRLRPDVHGTDGFFAALMERGA